MKRKMKIDDGIHIIAGILVMVSLALGTWVHPYWHVITLFVGANLFQYGFSGFCPLGIILGKLGIEK